MHQLTISYVGKNIKESKKSKQITIIDSSAVTDANLTPVKNTLLNKAPTQTVSDSSGGTIVYLSLFSLLLLLVRRRVINH